MCELSTDGGVGIHWAEGLWLEGRKDRTPRRGNSYAKALRQKEHGGGRKRSSRAGKLCRATRLRGRREGVEQALGDHGKELGVYS